VLRTILATALLMLASEGASAFSITNITASANDGNVPANTRDGNLTTRWSADGNPQWIKYQFAATTAISAVIINFYKGNERVSNFDILVSNDDITYTPVLTGAASGGTTLNAQTFTFPSPVQCRYIEYLGHGNSVNTWNSLVEVNFTESSLLQASPATLAFGSAAGNQTLTVTANVAWTATDDAAWLTLTPASGTNNGAITVAATANSGAARSGTITLTGGGLSRTVGVTQAGTAASLTASPSSLAFASTAASQTLTITANVAWTTTDDQTWITVSPASGSNNGTATVTVTQNTGSTTRNGTVTVTGGGITASVPVSQSGTSTSSFLPLSGGTMTGNIGFTGGAGITGAGVISANEIRIGAWSMKTPDYVFAPDYPLAPLKDVKNFIEANHHLPGVPSAAQMAQGDVNLAEINMILLRKVEELTLYMLEQQKEIERLKAR
jgi:hypothetical protein